MFKVWIFSLQWFLVYRGGPKLGIYQCGVLPGGYIPSLCIPLSQTLGLWWAALWLLLLETNSFSSKITLRRQLNPLCRLVFFPQNSSGSAIYSRVVYCYFQIFPVCRLLPVSLLVFSTKLTSVSLITCESLIRYSRVPGIQYRHKNPLMQSYKMSPHLISLS